MTKIYEQHSSAFQYVSAYVVTDKDGNRVASIALKFPKDGAGRLYAYVHFFGHEMARGYAGGYGYDKRSAAVQSAIMSIKLKNLSESEDWSREYDRKANEELETFRQGFADIGGHDWIDIFRKNGFNVLQAV